MRKVILFDLIMVAYGLTTMITISTTKSEVVRLLFAVLFIGLMFAKVHSEERKKVTKR